jgi:hypothetical protein
MSTIVNRIKNRTPFLSKTLPAIYGTDGEVKELYQGGTNNILNIIFNPGFVSKYKSSSGIDLVLQLYKKSEGNKKQFPRTVSGKTISYNGKNVKLTASEIGELQKMIGQETILMLNEISKDKDFANVPVDDQIATIVSVMDSIGENARYTLKDKIGETELNKRSTEAKN